MKKSQHDEFQQRQMQSFGEESQNMHGNGRNHSRQLYMQKVSGYHGGLHMEHELTG